MAYCGPRGIPLSTFLRWEPDDQHAALDWAAFEGARCPKCGTHPDEWADDRFAYHAHLTQCKGCREQQRVAEAPEAREGRGVYVVSAPGSAAECSRCQPVSVE